MPPLFGAVLRTPTKRIGLTILGTWSVNDIEIIAVQLKYPSCLSSIKRFVGSKPLQASVISKNTDLMFRTLEITSPLLKRRADCKQFLVVDLVVNLMLIHLSRMKSNRVQAAFDLLRQYSSDCEIRSITFNDALELRVEVP